MALSLHHTGSSACVRARAVVLLLAVAAGCGDDPELVLQIRVPPDDQGPVSYTHLTLPTN